MAVSGDVIFAELVTRHFNPEDQHRNFLILSSNPDGVHSSLQVPRLKCNTDSFHKYPANLLTIYVTIRFSGRDCSLGLVCYLSQSA